MSGGGNDLAEYGKIEVEIAYCVPCSYQGHAMWLGSEFYAAVGNEVAIRLTPRDGGTLQIFFDGENVYDKKEEDGVFPDVNRVKAMKADLQRRVEDPVLVG